jgi:AAA family ATP:ADP antiporter
MPTNLRTTLLASLAFTIIASYASARSTIDSLFLAHFKSDQLPQVWLATALTTAIVISAYNHFNIRRGLLSILSIASLLSAACVAAILLAFNLTEESWLIFALCVWKEVYIVVLIEIFWSYADVIFSLHMARKTYGILLAMGSVGGFLVNFSVGPVALSFGTLSAVWLVVPILCFCSALALVCRRWIGDPPPAPTKNEQESWPKTSSIQVLLKSHYLVPLLFIVTCVQIVVALVDFDFNRMLQVTYPSVDERTNIIGNIYAIIDLGSVALQICMVHILRLLGVGGALLAVPTVLSGIAVLFAAFPVFSSVVALKASTKCFDYSVFRAAKEILYIPLSRREKTQGKALIDMLTYRVAKGLSSLLLMVVVALSLSQYILSMAMLCLLAWILLTVVVVRRYHHMPTNGSTKT